MNTEATMRIPVVAGVMAGLNIPDDATEWEITGFRNVRKIATSDHNASFAIVPLQGDSLKELNIVDGDMAVMRITRDYIDGKLGVWQTPHGRTCKFAYYDFDGSVVLHNENGWQQRWDATELRLLGVVERIERDM